MSAIDYKVAEGDKIGFLPSEFGTNGQLVERKFVAAGAISKGQLVEVSDNLTVKAATAGSDKVVGVAMFDADDGGNIAFEAEGLFKLKAGAAITAPAVLSAGASGTVVPQTAGVPGTSFPTKSVGVALTDAAQNDYVYVKFSI